MIRVQGSLVHLDAGPARLLAQLRAAGGDVYLTACAPDGRARHERLPEGIRRARYRLGERSVETTPAAAFVAIADDEGGLVVAALEGEVVVVEANGDRTALGAHETLLTAATGEPRVLATAALDADALARVDAAIELATQALLEPLIVEEPAATEPITAVPVTTPAVDATAAAEPQPAEPEVATEPQTTEAIEPVEPEPEPERESETASAAREAPPEAEAEEEIAERRGIAFGVSIGALIAVALLVAALTVLPDGSSGRTSAGASTTVQQTTAQPTTTTEAPTTTRRATTTTARPTTTSAPAVASYTVEPESCRQNDGKVTFVGSLTNTASSTSWRYRVRVTFRDSAGETLSSAQANVGPLKPGDKESFTVEGDAPRPAASCDIEDVQATLAS